MEAESRVEDGGFIYVEFTSINAVNIFVSIKKSMDDADIICNVTQGDIILLRHPNKMYLSFIGEGASAKFFVNTHYSPSLTSIPFVNE